MLYPLYPPGSYRALSHANVEDTTAGGALGSECIGITKERSDAAPRKAANLVIRGIRVGCQVSVIAGGGSRL